MPRSARIEGYSRRHRFTAQGSFGAVLRGTRKLRGHHAVLHVTPGRSGASRLGIALTRRLVPSSADRNRVKRLVRETFRRHELKAVGLDCVVALRQRFDAQTEASLMAEIRAFFDQLCTTPSR